MARKTRNFGANKVSNFGEVKALREEFNKLLDEFDTLATKLNADAGVTDTNYNAAPVAAKVL
jgi:hypothetical protein